MMTKIFVWLNTVLYRLTGGSIGGNMGGAMILLLTTVGRKTGKERTTPLRYLTHDDGYMILASNYGKDKPPAWLLNLQAKPTVNIQVLNKRMTARPEVITDDRQPALYQQFIDVDPRFIEYEKTAKPRTIAVIVLHPQP